MAATTLADYGHASHGFAAANTIRHNGSTRSGLFLCSTARFCIAIRHDQHLVHGDVNLRICSLGATMRYCSLILVLLRLLILLLPWSISLPMGTLFYMAPDSFRRRPQPASDQYALAVTTYTALRQGPFDGSMSEITLSTWRFSHRLCAPTAQRSRLPWSRLFLRV